MGGRVFGVNILVGRLLCFLGNLVFVIILFFFNLFLLFDEENKKLVFINKCFEFLLYCIINIDLVNKGKKVFFRLNYFCYCILFLRYIFE